MFGFELQQLRFGKFHLFAPINTAMGKAHLPSYVCMVLLLHGHIPHVSRPPSSSIIVGSSSSAIVDIDSFGTIAALVQRWYKTVVGVGRSEQRPVVSIVTHTKKTYLEHLVPTQRFFLVYVYTIHRTPGTNSISISSSVIKQAS
ncbi:hypothetical protein IV203_023894 [Nitzschia inconspicua]|uniref:Uncharacterized protein n=1 Tax=Nitzschia inconspicua TaxID=303405 RepID=A0A9K3KBZ3_9STRA|nr:hypothetical protein IV203_023894 [Nitzschia inconspicua]